nr:PREDICTED: zinc finger CCCH domain-containing protein 3 isoform X1 [Lepisosteus oculatus]
MTIIVVYLAMEEREALKKQIELLQTLINNHKSVHGDAPSGARTWSRPRQATASSQSRSTEFSRSHPAQTRPFESQPPGYWRKKYSLSNKHTAPEGTVVIHTGPAGTAVKSAVSSSVQHLPNQPVGPSSSSGVTADPQITSASATLLSGNSALTARQQSKGLLISKHQAALSSSLLLSSGLNNNLSQQNPVLLLSSQGSDTGLTGKSKTIKNSSLTQAVLIPKGSQNSALPSGPVSTSPQTCGLNENVQPKPSSLPRADSGDGSSGHVSMSHGCSLDKKTVSPKASVLRAKTTTPSTLLQVKPHFLSKSVKDPKPASSDPASITSHHITKITSSVLSSSSSQTDTGSDAGDKNAGKLLTALPQPSSVWGRAASVKRSRYTWVKKTQEGLAGPSHIEAFKGSGTAKPALSPASQPHAPSLSSGKKRTVAASRTLRISNPSPPPLGTQLPKAAKTQYTWVSAAARPPQPSRKPLSPTQKAGGLSKNLKLRAKPTAPHMVKSKKAGGVSCPQQAQGSKYRWRAAAQTQAAAAASRSVYQWKVEKENGHRAESGHSSVIQAPHSKPVLSPSPSPYKLKSRMKIIRRKSSGSVAVVERRGSADWLMVKTQFSLRRRRQSVGKSPPLARRAPAKGLVPIGRHKLRRLPSASSQGSARTGFSSPSLRNSSTQRVIKTRYKIVTRGAASISPAVHSSPSLSWRVRRIHSARTVLQTRLRAPQDRQPPQRPWRGRSMRWIGGALYRVSANKLCKTPTLPVPSSGSIQHRAGKWADLSGSSIPGTPTSSSRASTSRHIASRAVQRSLAIIRQARLKKQQGREYCMYYNRFGKCNRGQDCPYIHDPEKVAVCTRFLRGTCKQTDGTCPFSHKVSKDKMPVCSYFLKGICNNNSCPYSHVYVSRKAAVCQDFVRGYCPLGEKCKKKHTLLCPDFTKKGACPHGAKCKLQHRQRARGTRPHRPEDSAQRSGSEEALVRSSPAQGSGPALGENTPAEAATSGPEKLPSYISLHSSPGSSEVSTELEVPVSEGTEGTEKRLQIKPRF